MKNCILLKCLFLLFTLGFSARAMAIDADIVVALDGKVGQTLTVKNGGVDVQLQPGVYILMNEKGAITKLMVQ